MVKKKKFKIKRRFLSDKYKEKEKNIKNDVSKTLDVKRRNVKQKEIIKKKQTLTNSDKKIKNIKSKTSNKISKPKSFKKYKFKLNFKRIIIIIILFIIIITSIWILNNMYLLGLTTKKIVNKQDSVIIDLASGNNDIYSYNNDLLIYSNGMIKTYNKYGKKTWSYKFEEIFTPTINIKGKYLEVINKDSGYIYLFQNHYEIARIKINGDIKETNLNKNGDVAVLYNSPGVKAVICIYDKRGKEFCKIKPESINIANIAISNNSRYLAYTEVIMDGISIAENINIVDTTKTNNIKLVKKITSEIIFGLDINKYNLDVKSDKTIYRYNIRNEKIIQEDISNLNTTYLDYKNKTISTISKDLKNDSKSKLILKKIGERKENVVVLEGVPRNLRHVNNLSYVIYQKQIEIFNNFGMKIKEYNSDSIIVDLYIFNNGKSIAIPYSNKIEIINM